MASCGSDYDGIETSVAERPQKPKVCVGGWGGWEHEPRPGDTKGDVDSQTYWKDLRRQCVTG